jgi:soluble lytic murein transglycosylase
VRSRNDNAYDAFIREAAQRHGISWLLVKAVIRQESKFRPWAVGDAGEMGLMQITDGVVKDWETATGAECRFRNMLFDPRLNIEIGTWYLAQALQEWKAYRDAEVLALAAYNAGPSRSRAWAPADPSENALDRVRFSSTKAYIKSVLHYRKSYQENARREQE